MDPLLSRLHGVSTGIITATVLGVDPSTEHHGFHGLRSLLGCLDFRGGCQPSSGLPHHPW